MTIGLPRALLYYRYSVLWETFFHELGIETVLSPPTNKEIQEIGDRYAIDENCLSSKLFLGHVVSLADKCDAVFVPRIADFGESGIMCSRFESLYDMCVNTFRREDIRFISCDVDIHNKKPEEEAYILLGTELGHTKEEAQAAFRKAREALTAHRAKKIEEQEAALSSSDRIKILVVGHEYNLYDEYIGKPIMEGIRRLDALPVYADAVDTEQAQSDSLEICAYVPWMVSRELLGAVVKYRSRVDGIILLTAFPCGPDSMINEMIIRRVKDKPILNLLLDSQDASTGVETRLESFIDIIRFREEMNNHG